MIVGDENVGKTSLLNCLKQEKKKDTIAIDGIDIQDWVENIIVENNKVELKFSVWDFAGQDIYLITHSFVLSRSIYLIVFNPFENSFNKPLMPMTRLVILLF